MVCVAVALVLGVSGCAPTRAGGPGTSDPASPSPTCASASIGGGPTPKPAETIGAGPVPPAPLRVALMDGPEPDEVTAEAVAPSGAEYDAVQVRFFVDSCAVPYTDEGDELPQHVLSGLRRGDRVQALARLDGEGGNSAETSSPVLVVP